MWKAYLHSRSVGALRNIAAGMYGGLVVHLAPHVLLGRLETLVTEP